MQAPIPAPEQIGSVDLDTWRVVPAESNPDKHEHGAWAIAGGDGDEYDLYLEVLDADQPQKVAQFIVDAVSQHARQLRLQGALARVEQVWAQQQEDERAGVLAVSNPGLPDAVKLAQLVAAMGDLAHAVGEVVPQQQRAAHRERVYDQLAQVASITVAWMEATLS
ncbi:hypothetical protein [Nonomuraea sp. CA-141351]|uniref:hypothetical protein n=1 Tax=Nonomuraea sp. CA-141351 TaxID=3239996 RepID=UPI003D8E7D2C